MLSGFQIRIPVGNFGINRCNFQWKGEDRWREIVAGRS